MNITDFHIHDGLLCDLSHLFVPTSEFAKIIWEAHYSRMEGHFGMEKTMANMMPKKCTMAKLWPFHGNYIKLEGKFFYVQK
jgi:hypothetical protein